MAQEFPTIANASFNALDSSTSDSNADAILMHAISARDDDISGSKDLRFDSCLIIIGCVTIDTAVEMLCFKIRHLELSMENLRATEVEIEEESCATMFEYITDLKVILRAGRAYIASLPPGQIRHTDPGVISTKRAAVEAHGEIEWVRCWRNNAHTPLPNSGAPSLQRSLCARHCLKNIYRPLALPPRLTQTVAQNHPNSSPLTAPELWKTDDGASPSQSVCVEIEACAIYHLLPNSVLCSHKFIMNFEVYHKRELPTDVESDTYLTQGRSGS
ncbi:hypothetical protein Hypma_001046 [Hypsizygus marmoreus]|uniref:Uncharacterized protein n=1 Tax=Hypsizygus marmoreus TaxID=39966 RepID=A0A369J6A7_HYPMA|nr:hypothetical protein Hypma_001046 [Hypsizygus marmoreus]